MVVQLESEPSEAAAELAVAVWASEQPAASEAALVPAVQLTVTALLELAASVAFWAQQPKEVVFSLLREVEALEASGL